MSAGEYWGGVDLTRRVVDVRGPAPKAHGAAWLLAAICAVALLAACGAGETTAVQTTTPAVTTTPSHGATGSTPVPTRTAPETAPSTISGGTVEPESTASERAVRRVTVDELVATGDELLDVIVELRARAFLLQSCPPPGGETAECSVAVMLIDPADTDLLYGDRGRAVPALQDGRRVACGDVAGTGSTCLGWEHLAVYEITGVVRSTGGTPPFELDVHSREAT
jgi:hypothetical protein